MTGTDPGDPWPTSIAGWLKSFPVEPPEIFVGEIVSGELQGGQPLLYHAGKYRGSPIERGPRPRSPPPPPSIAPTAWMRRRSLQVSIAAQCGRLGYLTTSACSAGWGSHVPYCCLPVRRPPGHFLCRPIPRYLDSRHFTVSPPPRPRPTSRSNRVSPRPPNPIPCSAPSRPPPPLQTFSMIGHRPDPPAAWNCKARLRTPPPETVSKVTGCSRRGGTELLPLTPIRTSWPISRSPVVLEGALNSSLRFPCRRRPRMTNPR